MSVTLSEERFKQTNRVRVVTEMRSQSVVIGDWTAGRLSPDGNTRESACEPPAPFLWNELESELRSEDTFVQDDRRHADATSTWRNTYNIGSSTIPECLQHLRCGDCLGPLTIRLPNISSGA
jgi:hypothetical protein